MSFKQFYQPVVPLPDREPVKVTQAAMPSIECDFCGDSIGLEERAVELVIGPIRMGPKSGRLMVEVDREEPHEGIATVHEWCVAGYAQQNICQDQTMYDDEYPPVCTFCEMEIDD